MYLFKICHLQKSNGLFLFCLAFFCLIACDTPSKQQITRDFNELFFKEVGKDIQADIVSIGPGEGDSRNVYQHVRFNIVAVKSVYIKNGWFAGISMDKGQKLYGGEVVLLYQDVGGLQWKMTRFELKHKPR
ncbi:MAG: hypothetical protein PHU23_14610 [Dehalococcoidales bacterium]|nr:hypothetical protein [Dehalococcoidales bacterium]